MSGIVDLAYVLPSGTARVEDLARSSGLPADRIQQITVTPQWPVLAPREQPWDLAIQAARTVLDRTGVDPAAIGKVVYAGSGEWEPAFWSPAAKAADVLDIREAHCMEVVNFCNSATPALQLACDETALARSEYVLVLLGDRLSQLVDHEDPESKALFNFADAAAAVLVGRQGGEFEILRSQLRTDASWADYYSADREDFTTLVRRRGRRSGLRQAYLKNLAELVGLTLESLGRSREDVAHLLINQTDRTMHEELLSNLGIAPERSVFNYHRYAHQGPADTFIALADLRADGRLNAGDLILLCTSGVGFSWGVTAVEYRPGLTAPRAA
ncbi:3-oxoacyl-[acyl-carrier-protein] synthase III C-terminal domain-containing protein [Streptomyces sp. NPDC048664]|uniref:3-oxoacyl-ACP synthase III family protein n=1 Tax=Streptomyces sp. NPDC048664 TaxID=3154505 RepID=UPI00341F889A